MFQMPTTNPLEQMQSEMLQTKIDWNIPLSSNDLFMVLDAQKKHFAEYRSDVTRLSKILPHDMLTAVSAGGQASVPWMDALLRMTPAKRKAYIAEWNAGQKKIQVAARQDFKNELASWRKLGHSVIKAMMEGMDKESAKIDTWVKGIAQRLLASVGITLATVLADAVAKKKHEPTSTVTGTPGAKKPPKKGTRTTQGRESQDPYWGGNYPDKTTVHMTVNAMSGETLWSTMNKSAWRLKHNLK
jgi:hypothetical protein